jgi:hypothetical protein
MNTVGPRNCFDMTDSATELAAFVKNGTSFNSGLGTAPASEFKDLGVSRIFDGVQGCPLLGGLRTEVFKRVR